MFVLVKGSAAPEGQMNMIYLTFSAGLDIGCRVTARYLATRSL